MTNRKLPPFDSNGFYLPDGRPDPYGCYGPPEPAAEDEVETAIAYLSLLKPTKHATSYSYYLKHRAENWGRSNGRCPYVSNGALITAAIRLGLSIEPQGINAGIGVSKHDVKALCKKETPRRVKENA